MKRFVKRFVKQPISQQPECGFIFDYCPVRQLHTAVLCISFKYKILTRPLLGIYTHDALCVELFIIRDNIEVINQDKSPDKLSLTWFCTADAFDHS